MSQFEQGNAQLQQALLSWTLELAPHGVFTTDQELRITSWNHWLERHSALRAEQVVGRALLEIMPSLGERRLAAYFSDALRGEVKILSRALHGYLLPLPPPIPDTGFEHMQQSARIAPLLLEGKVCGTITMVEDVTEREWQNRILRESEERFRVMADTVPDIIFTADARGGIEFLNQRFYQSTGLPPRSGLGSTWLQLVHPEDIESVQVCWRHSMETGEPLVLECRLKNTGDHFRWFISRAWPIRDDQQRIVRWFGAATDIHDLKQTQLELAGAQAKLTDHAAHLEQTVADRTSKLRETISHLESFSYTVAHDLRAPIRAIEGYTGILLGDSASGLKPQSAALLQNIARSARHLDALARDILSYTKVSTQDVQLQPVDPVESIGNILAINPALQAPHANVAVVRPLSLMMAHPTMLAQCLSNLLENAAKFVAPEVLPRIVISSEPVDAGKKVRLWVEDNGIGMDALAQQKAFGIFERARGASKYPGTGIGLAIVAKAVERMRGQCGVESTPGKGSRFWIELAAPTKLLLADVRMDNP